MTSSSLGDHAARGAGVTIIGQAIRVGSQLVGVIILARLLAPSDFGLVVMVTAIAGVGEVLRDLGLSASAIQAKNLSVSQRDNLFWINSGLGVALTLLCAAAAPLLVAIYDEPRLLWITLAVSPIFLINGVATQFRASINRSMRFRTLVLIDTGSPVVALVLAIVLAMAAGSYWALVAQVITAPLIALGLSIWFARWRPRSYSRAAGMRGLLVFGGNLTAVQLLNYASRNVDVVMIGLVGGAGMAGLYDRAMQLVTQPINQINQPVAKVTLPVLSRLQDEPDRYSRFLLEAQILLLHPLAAALALVAAAADPIVQLLLGPEWVGAVVFVRILVIGALAQAANHIIYVVFLSLGKSKELLHYSLVSRPLMIASILAGAMVGGAEGVAWGLSVSLVILLPIALFWIRKFPGVHSTVLFANFARVVLVYGTAAAAAGASLQLLAGLPAAVSLALAVAAIILVAGIWTAVWPSVRRDMRSLVATGQRMLRR